MDLVHLHSHSSFSVFDGIGSPESLAQRAGELGLPAQAITDHGRVGGIVEFHKACGKHGVVPIHGMEAYVQADDIGEKGKAAHLILLAGDQEGLHNLYALSSLAEENQYRGRGCITRSQLERLNEGLVVGSACIGSEVGQLILAGDMAAARRRAAWYRDVCGDRYFLELQNQNDGQPDRSHLIFMNGVIQLGQELDIPVVATNDSHYVCGADKEIHRLVILLGQKGDLLDAYAGDMSILDRRAFMRKLRVGNDVDITPFVDNTMVVWKRLREMGVENVNPCRTSIAMPAYRYVGAKVAARKMDPIERIRRVCRANLKTLRRRGTLDRRTPTPTGWSPMDDATYQNYLDRIEHELRIIDKTGFGDYFLIVADYVRYVKDDLNTLVGSGRGSAAGSIVAYLLRITEVDPIKYDLMFERMLNEDRPANKPPDIDLDFTPEVRTKVIEYLEERYGADKVVRIGSYGNMKLRDAVRRVGSYAKMTRSAVGEIANKIPEKVETVPDLMQRDKNGSFVFEQLAESFERDKELWRLVDGLTRVSVKHEARHAAGVIVSSEPVQRWCPTRIPHGQDTESVPITQFDMYSLEDIGLIKFDLLVLGTMNVLTDCVNAVREDIRETEGDAAADAFTLASIDLEDERVYELFAKANTRGIFQLSSNPSIRELFAKLQPRSIADIAVGCALYRPGPLGSRAYWDGVEDPQVRKERGMSTTTRSAVDEYLRRRGGRAKVHSIHPLVDKVLESTFGILVYQEQILKLATECAGYTTLEADKLREAVGKKKQDMLAVEKPRFLAGATRVLGDALIAGNLWDFIEQFGDYGFNLAHSVSYAFLSYQTAWFKTYHPALFYAALINQELRVRRHDRAVEYIYDAPRNGVAVLPPNILEADGPCKVTEGGKAIQMGLEGVKGISSAGSVVLRRVVADPENHTLEGFLLAAPPKKIRNSLLSDIAEIGLMDSMLGIDDKMAFGEKLYIRGRMVAAMEHANAWRDRCKKDPTFASADGFHADVERILKEKILYYEMRDLSKESNRRHHETWTQRLHSFQSFRLNVDHVLSRENVLLGIFISGDPLANYRDILDGTGVTPLAGLEPKDHSSYGEFAGVVSSVTMRNAKASKRQYLEIQLADATESVECVVFFNERVRESAIKVGNVLRVQAAVEWKSGHTYVLRFRSVNVLGNLANQSRQAYRVGVNCRKLRIREMIDIRSEILQAPNGASPVYMECGGTVGFVKSIAITGELYTYLQAHDHVKFDELITDSPEEMAS